MSHENFLFLLVDDQQSLVENLAKMTYLEKMIHDYNESHD